MFSSNRKQDLVSSAITDVKHFFEGFEDAPKKTLNAGDPAEQPLLNLQPMTIKQAGYIGRNLQGGAFDLDSGLRTALKNGVRAYTLQVDSLTKKKAGFPAEVGEPTLLYRSDSGALVSSNGASLKAAAEMFANYAFAEESMGASLPLVLYLHFTKTPDPIKAPEEYLNFLAATAEALEPLQKFALTNSAEGPLGRQQNELGVLRLPVGQISKKAVIISNADTSLFRRTAQLGMKGFDPKRDLDAMVNIRAYAETSADIVGATGLAPTNSSKVNAILVSLDRVLKLSPKEKEGFRELAKTRFIIALKPQMAEITRQELDAAYALGINLIPIHPFGKDKDELNRILALWKPQKFLKERPVALQAAAAALPKM